MSNYKSILVGLLLGPLTTYPVTYIWFYLFYVFDDWQVTFDISVIFVVATIGLVVFAYPATIILCLTIYFLFKNREIGKNPLLYITPAVGFTAIVANKDLLDSNGLFGAIYLSCAASCSCLFWYIAIYRANKRMQTDRQTAARFVDR